MKTLILSLLFIFQVSQNDQEIIFTTYENCFLDFLEYEKYLISDKDSENTKTQKLTRKTQSEMWLEIVLKDVKDSVESKEITNEKLINLIESELKRRSFEKIEDEFFVKVQQKLKEKGIYSD